MTSAARAAPYTEPEKPFILLATVGSTLFPDLTNKLLSPSILSLLPSLGVTKLIVQYGRADILALTEIEDVEVDSEGRGEFTWVDYNGLGEVRVEVLRYTNDLKSLIDKASAVISHAGSGSVVEVIRKKPLLVVPNTSLMDNHQAELATALEEQGYLVASTVDKLEDKLPMFLNMQAGHQTKPFPGVQTQVFKAILDTTMGYL